jgi:hypothetical protein
MNEQQYEPLPYTDISLFREEFDSNQMKINRNLYALHKCVFVPNQSIKVNVQAENKTNQSLSYV